MRNEDEDTKLKVENRSLKLKIKDLIKEINTLKSQMKTLEAVFHKTESYLKEQTKGSSLEDLIKQANGGKKVVIEKHSCSKCKSIEVMVRSYRDFKTIKCTVCEFIKRVDHD